MSLTLSDAQIRQFEDKGYLFLPDVFSAAETDLLLREAHSIFAVDRKEVVRELDGKTVRTAFAAQHYNEAYHRLSRHPRLVKPVQQILGDGVYMHQFKINAKAAFDGDVWQWHQDYGVWSRDDLMPECRAMNIALFLEEVTEFNGALMFIPGSHKKGTLEAGHDQETTSYPLWTIDNATISRLVAEGGVVAPKGSAGSIVMFNGNLVHGSPSNMSPFDRTIVYLSLCHVENHIRRFKRPPWVAQRDFTPIECLEDDCLLALSREEEAQAVAAD